MIFHGRFPSEKAAALFTAKNAEAFADEGREVTILVPRRLGRIKQNVSHYYGLRNNFSVVYLPTIDLFSVPGFNRAAFFLSFLIFSISTKFYLLAKAKRDDIIYSNEWLPLWFASFSFKNTFYELHDFPESKTMLFGRFIKRMRWVLIHNKWKLEKAKQLFGLDEKKIIYQANAVDIKQFDIEVMKEAARAQLGLPQDRSIVVYTGHLYSWKGVQTLADAVQYLPPNVTCYFVGGTAKDAEAFKRKNALKDGINERIVVVGHRNYREIPLWQKAADVLVLPNTAKEDISKFYTSPMKMFEYMASKRPIVASDIPSVTEILSSKNAILVKPDDAKDLARGIDQALSFSARDVEKITHNAFDTVSTHTWSMRAQAILSFIRS